MQQPETTHADASWWDNHHHGRVLACRHQQVVVFVPVVGAFCSECRTDLEIVEAA